MEESDKIKNIIDILNSCLLPELSKELGSTDIKAGDFDSFLQNLDFNLVELFDLIQRNEDFLINNSNDFVELKSKLILLICEQTSPDAGGLFQTRQQHLLKNLNVLCEKHFENILNNDEKTKENIINFYKLKLNKQIWKNNIGSIYGFMQFLRRFGNLNKTMDIKFSTFVLSIGLLLRDFYDPLYKRLGIQMFNIILKHSSTAEIKEMNIHKVIYEETCKDISKFEKSFEVEIIWNCLYDCLFLMDEEFMNNHKWSKVDDLIKNLINQIIFAKSSDIWLTLFHFILKFVLIGNKNQSEIVRIINDINMSSNDKILIIRKRNTEQSNISFRWVKSILELFAVESNYFMGNENIASKALEIMHITYLICILPIKFEIIEPHLIEFIEKWLLILMETLRIHSNHFIIKQDIKEFLQTLLIQIENFQIIDKSRKIEESYNAIKLLLSNEIFLVSK